MIFAPKIPDGSGKIVTESDLATALKNKIITPNWFIPSHFRAKHKYYNNPTDAGIETWRGEYYSFLSGSGYSGNYHIGLCNLSYMHRGKLIFDTNNNEDWATAGVPNTWVHIRFSRPHIITKIALRGRFSGDHFTKWKLLGVTDWDDRAEDVLLLDYSATSFPLDNSQIHYFNNTNPANIVGFEFVTYEGEGNPGLSVFNAKGFEVSSIE